MLPPVPEPRLPLLQDRSFRLLIYSRALSRIAQNAVNFALVLLIVEETGKTITSSLLVLVLVAPATVGGIAAGALADALPGRLVAVTGNLLRAVTCYWFAGNTGEVPLFFAAGAIVSLGAQLATAPDNAMTLSIIEREQLARANAIGQATTVVAQLAGFGILVPVMLRLFDSPEALFYACSSLFMLAAIQVMFVRGRRRVDAEVGSRAEGSWWSAGWKQIRGDAQVVRAVAELTVLSTAMIVLGGLLPRFIHDELKLPVDAGVLVFVPAAFGLAIGLRLAPVFAKHLPHALVSTAGLAAFGSLLAVFALANETADFLVGYGFFEWINTVAVGPLRRGAVLAALIAFPLGLAFAFISVAAHTLIGDRVPVSLQGRVMSTQGAIGALAALLPVLAAGLVADLSGSKPVILATAVGIAAMAVLNLRPGRRHAN